jgi:hypothetical protein
VREERTLEIATTKYITVNSDPDSWGDVPADFDHDAEAAKIRDAAEESGLTVYDARPKGMDEDGEIDWFSTWCGIGYEWSMRRWADWFEKRR